jgi:hypothetical protein
MNEHKINKNLRSLMVQQLNTLNNDTILKSDVFMLHFICLNRCRSDGLFYKFSFKITFY